MYVFIVSWTCVVDAWAPRVTWGCSSSWPCKNRTGMRRRAVCYTRTCGVAAGFSCICTLCDILHMDNVYSLHRQTLKPGQQFLYNMVQCLFSFLVLVNPTFIYFPSKSRCFMRIIKLVALITITALYYNHVKTWTVYKKTIPLLNTIENYLKDLSHFVNWSRHRN